MSTGLSILVFLVVVALNGLILGGRRWRGVERGAALLQDTRRARVALPALGDDERALLRAWLDAELRSLGAVMPPEPAPDTRLAVDLDGVGLVFTLDERVPTVAACFGEALAPAFVLVPNCGQHLAHTLTTGVSHFDDAFVLTSRERRALELFPTPRRVALIELFAGTAELVAIDERGVTLALPPVTDVTEVAWRVALRERVELLQRGVGLFDSRRPEAVAPRPVRWPDEPLAFLPPPSLELAFAPLELAAPGGGWLRVTLDDTALTVSPSGERLVLDAPFGAQLSWACDARGRTVLHLALRQQAANGAWTRFELSSLTTSFGAPVRGLPELARDGAVMPEEAMRVLLARLRGSLQLQGLPERWLD